MSLSPQVKNWTVVLKTLTGLPNQHLQFLHARRRQPHSLRVRSGLSRLQPVYSKANPQGSSGFLVPGCVHPPVRFSMLPGSCSPAPGAEGFSRCCSISMACVGAAGCAQEPWEVEDALQVCSPQPDQHRLWDHTEWKRAERNLPAGAAVTNDARAQTLLWVIYKGCLHPGLSCPAQSQGLCREGHLSWKQALLALLSLPWKQISPKYTGKN